ncbi:NAD(P)-dependent oxidoreductase [Pseudonocardia pini]|uniref:NAD(P)-dependent oxidoreductase n=1 Tax=Pseudonocardia pini TaxID=2758030 RepID=UPI0015F050A6|nr:NAD(P)-dependent oxidoreductase [Pseudonocardia pini]
MSARTVGLVGLGNIGTPMGLSLLRAGLGLVVRDLREEAAAECVAAGARFAASNAELLDATDLIGIAVVDDRQLRALMLGEDGLLDQAKPGTTFIVHSTVLPATIHEVAAAADERGVNVVDAQVSGGDLRAREGDLALMVGGRAEDVERCTEYFAAVGRRAQHMGESGSGAATKVAIQMMTFGNWIAAMEAMRLARALGIDEKVLADFATDTTADSWVAQTWGNYDRLQREHRLAGTEDLYRLFDKDLFNGVALGRELGLQLPVTAVSSQVLADTWKERLGIDEPAQD